MKKRSFNLLIFLICIYSFDASSQIDSSIITGQFVSEIGITDTTTNFELTVWVNDTLDFKSIEIYVMDTTGSDPYLYKKYECSELISGNYFNSTNSFVIPIAGIKSSKPFHLMTNIKRSDMLQLPANYIEYP